MSIAIQRIERAIADMSKGGMQTGKQTIKLEYSDAQRAIAELTNLQRRNDELVTQVENLKAAATSAYAEWNYSNDVYAGMQRLMMVIKATPTQCLREIKAEAGRAGFVEGYDSCWVQHYGTRAPEHATAYSSEQYAESVNAGEK